MNDLTQVEDAVKRCEDILQQVEKRASEIQSLHDKMELMIEMVQKNSLTMNQSQELEIKRELMKVAKKAAKKAAKKSMAIAQARINMGLEEP